jgi:hypothetical protein
MSGPSFLETNQEPEQCSQRSLTDLVRIWNIEVPRLPS